MITLRDLRQEDIGLLVKFLNNENVTRYLSTRIPQPYTTKDAEWWVNSGSKVGIAKAITINKELAGVIGVTPGEFERSRSAEIGYWLGESYWGNGVATKAVTLMTDNVFASTEIIRLFAPIFAPNVASIRVAKKCGYKFEGVCEKVVYKKGQFIDVHVYAKINS